MLNNLLDTIVSGNGSSWAGQTQESGNWYFSNMAYCLLYALIGFVVVFIGISLLIFILWLIGYILKRFEGITEKQKPTKLVEVKETVATEAVEDNSSSDEISDEVKAVIMAAIIGYYDKKQEKCEFTVKRIKRL